MRHGHRSSLKGRNAGIAVAGPRSPGRGTHQFAHVADGSRLRRRASSGCIARTTLLARNEANGSSIGATAGTDGTFTLDLALSTGVNKITITGTDPAGNVTVATLSVGRGSGKLTVSLSASTYQIKRSQLPAPVTLSATVTDPDGRALAGANVTFTLSMPGIPTVTIDGKTSASGQASFTTTIPKGASIGQGSATVLVTTDAFGSTEDFTVISIV